MDAGYGSRFGSGLSTTCSAPSPCSGPLCVCWPLHELPGLPELLSTGVALAQGQGEGSDLGLPRQLHREGKEEEAVDSRWLWHGSLAGGGWVRLNQACFPG